MLRRKGGQPGNQNARKHGLYSSVLSPAQMLELTNALNAGGQDPALIALRIKLTSALKSAPNNRRLFMEASKILYKWYASKFGINQKDKAVFKMAVRTILQEMLENQIILTERIEAVNQEQIPCSATK
ncbi:MAG: hypothetical protein PHG35_08890 [Dehalococcoidales bacterium]|nr:hypothetical protein [Dehalococcoidales bacterium]